MSVTAEWGSILMSIGWFVLIYMILVISFYTILLVISLFQLRKTYGLDDWEPYEELLHLHQTKPVSILVPAYNESVGIMATVRSLLSIEYPEYEIIIINDGSTDDSMGKLVESFQLVKIKWVIREQLDTQPVKGVYQSRLYKNLLVIDKENGGKADALNAGIAYASGELFCAIDAGAVVCWDNNSAEPSGPIFDDIPQVINPVELRSDSNTVCVIDNMGKRCWGSDLQITNFP